MGGKKSTFHHQPSASLTPPKAAAAAASSSSSVTASSSVPIPLVDRPETPLLSASFYDEEANAYDDSSDAVLPPYRDVSPEGSEGGPAPGAEVAPANGDEPPPFSIYQPKLKRVTAMLGDDVRVESCDAHLNSDGEALFRWLKEENRIPPRPQLRIRGTHRERRPRSDNKGTDTRTVTDFDLLFSLSPYLLDQGSPGLLCTVPADEKARRGGAFARRAHPAENPQRSIRSWADQYCANDSALKSFVMRKTVTGWNHTFLSSRLTELVRATGYRGDIAVSFPVKDTIVECFPDNRVSRLRHSKPVRWVFYLTFLWLLAWPLLWAFTKRYEVVRSCWFLGRDRRWRVEGVQATQRQSVMTDEEWVERWKGAVIRCARMRREGFVTEEDLRAADAEGEWAAGGEARGSLPSLVRGLGMSQGRGVFGWGGDEDW